MHACSSERSLRYIFFMRSFLRSLVVGVALVAIPMTTYAADLTLSPASATETVGQPFTVQISVDPSGQTVNASDGTVTFDPTMLSVSSISKDNSAFSLWTADPTFSNSSGTITFSGGTPSGFAALSPILSVTFTPSAVGSTTVSFSKGSILAADGKGTDIYKNGDSASYTIGPASAAAAAPAPVDPSNLQDLSGDPTPIAPQIASIAAPKSDSWYASSTTDFYWVDTPDITGARVLVASTSDATPTQILKGAATSTIETNIQDGVWYFVAQLKNGSGWGPNGSFKVQIDTTPPEVFTIGIVAAPAAGGVAKFSFKTSDVTSGIDHYELIVGSTTDETLAVADVGEDGTYPIPPQGGGPTTVTINAYDKAGNVRTVTQQLTLPKVDKPVVASTDTTAVAGSPWSLESVIIIAILMGIIGMQYAWIRYTRKGVEAERARILTRVAEVRDTNDRVFSAMREEFEVTVNNFDEKPQMTPEERELLEHIKEVLDVSEEVIDSGIEDVKKMVRG